MGQATARERLRSAAPSLSVGVLTADLADLGAELHRIEDTGIACVHFDVMDGRFAPMLTIGPPVVAAVRCFAAGNVRCAVRASLRMSMWKSGRSRS